MTLPQMRRGRGRSGDERERIHALVEAYESSWAAGTVAEPSDFLPAPTDPLYPEVLCELVRVDMERRFDGRQGRARRLADYLSVYPELARDRDLARRVAFEEYRLRLQAGDQPSPDEYRASFDIDLLGLVPTRPPAEDEVLDDTEIDPRLGAWPRTFEGEGGAMVIRRRPFAEPASTDVASAWDEATFAVVDDESAIGPAAGWLDHRTVRSLPGLTTPLPEPGQTFLEFQLVAELGRGAFGRVYLAEQPELAGRRVALKVAPEVNIEARALARLEHPNIVPIHSVHRDEARGLGAVCMPYLGSVTLRDVLEELEGRGGGPPRSAADLLRGVESIKARRRTGPTEPAPPAASESTAAGLATAVVTPVVDTEPDADEASQAVPKPGSTERMSGSEILVEGSAPSSRISGQSLEALRRTDYVRAVLWLGARLAEGLDHAHSRGILHQDLKPANVLLADDGQPKLLDFNLALDATTPPTAAAAKIGGTLPYMAPEQLMSLRDRIPRGDARSDVYALGVILCQLLAGRQPFPIRRGAPEAVLEAMVADRLRGAPEVRQWNPAVGRSVAAIVGKCLAPEPSERYPSAEALAEDLRRELDDRPLAHAAEPWGRGKLVKAARRHRKVVAAAAVIAGATFILGFAVLMVQRAEAARVREHVLNEANGLRADLPGIRERLSIPYESDDPSADEAARQLRDRLNRFSAQDPGGWPASSVARQLDEPNRRRVRTVLGEAFQALARKSMSPQNLKSIGRGDEDDPLRDITRAFQSYPADLVPVSLINLRNYFERVAREGDSIASQSDTPPSDVDELTLWVRDRIGAGRAAEALATLGDPEDREDYRLHVPLRHARAVALRQTGRKAQALAELDDALLLASAKKSWILTDIDFLRAVLLIELGRPTEAIEALDHVLMNRPGLARAWFNRALAHERLGKPAEALKDAKRAQDLGYVRATTLRSLQSRLLGKLGKAEEAVSARIEALGLKPFDAIDWVSRAALRLRPPTDIEGALNDLDEALKLDPKCYDALMSRASILSERLGLTADGIKTLDVLLKAHPADANALASRGVLHARLGRFEEARADARAAVRLEPLPRVRYKVAGIYALTSREAPDDRAVALRHLTTALELDPSLATLPKIDPDLTPIRESAEVRSLLRSLVVEPPSSAVKR